MRRIFLILFVLLALASAATWCTLRERSAHPQIVWTAGLSPNRVEQVEAFHGWLRANGYVDRDGELLFTVRLETTDNQSALIQAVSGMAGDLIDHVPVKRFAPMGVLEEITGFARENGLDPAAGYGEAARRPADVRREAVRIFLQSRHARTSPQSRSVRKIRRRTAAGGVDSGRL